MVYPSHYESGFLGYENPAAHPYEVIKYSLDKAQERIDQFKEKQTVGDTSQNIKVAVLRPWLQNFDLGATYNASMIIKEKEAVYDSLCPNWKQKDLIIVLITADGFYGIQEIFIRRRL